jgi:opacity protein-like surface antigen
MAALVTAAALTGSSDRAAAQGILPFTMEARVGAAFPAAEFDPGAKAGYLLEATAKYSPLPFVSVYAGWSVAAFGAKDDAGFAGMDTRVRDSGLRLGGELGVPLVGLMIGVAPYVQAGALFNRAEVEVVGDESGTLGFKSRRTPGFEIAGGLRTSLIRSISITPELRYRRYNPEFEAEPEIGLADEVAYVVASLGFTFHF